MELKGRATGYIKGYLHRSQHASINIYKSDVPELGKPVIVDLPGDMTDGVYLHPIDYYWVKHDQNPELAHRLCEMWISKRIDSLYQASLTKIDNMYRDPQEIHERGVDKEYEKLWAENLKREEEGEFLGTNWRYDIRKAWNLDRLYIPLHNRRIYVSTGRGFGKSHWLSGLMNPDDIKSYAKFVEDQYQGVNYGPVRKEP